MDRKVGKGGRKSSYKGKKSNSHRQLLKRKLNKELEIGEQCLFRSKGKVYLGWLSNTGIAIPYDPKLKKVTHRNFTLNNDAMAIPVTSLKLNYDQDLVNTKVLILNDRFDASDPKEEFPEFSVGIVLCVEKEELWVKPRGKHAVLTTIDKVCSLPGQYNDLTNYEESGYNGNVSPSGFNMISLVYKSTMDRLNETINVYERTRQELLNASITNSDLANTLQTLTEKYSAALATIQQIDELRLSQVAEKSDQLRTLVAVLGKQKDDLKSQEREIISLNKEIHDLRQQLQQKDETIQDLQAQIQESQQIIKSQQQDIHTLRSEATVAQLQQATHLEYRPGGPINLLMTRKAGSTGKPSASVPITLPAYNNPSSVASQQSLDKRAEDIMKVLEAISNRRDGADHRDLVVQLSAFLKKYPSLVRDAVAEAKMNVYKELSSGECVDLKILLRLPMKRFRELRTILGNHGIHIFASESKMYDVLRGRRNFCDDTLEFGTLEMKKTAKAVVLDKIPFVRTKNLIAHLADLVRRHMKKGDMWDHDEFHGHIWVKVGGDKGGTSTKLSVQVVNVVLPNSPDNTDLIAMYEATDTYDNQHLVFSCYKADLELLQEPGYRLDLGPEYDSVHVRIFIYGDYEYLTKNFGHLGPNSRYPCLWCYVKREDLQKPNGKEHCPMIKDENGEWKEREGWPKKRTCDEVVRDLVDNLIDERNGGNPKTNGSLYHHCIIQSPVLPITTSMDHIVPPVLHIMLGLVQRYFNLLERLAQREDRGNLGERSPELNERWENASINVQDKEFSIAEEEEVLKVEENFLKGFKAAAQGRDTSDDALSDEACSYPVCALVHGNPYGERIEVKWIQCVECGDGPNGTLGWYHLGCLGSTEYTDGMDNFVCPVCEGKVASAREVVDIQKKKVEKQKKCVKKVKDEHKEAQSELKKVFEEVSEGMGKVETNLNEVLKTKLKVERQAFHSQCFVGNHCKIIMEHHELLLEVLEDDCSLAEVDRHRQLFTQLRDIFKYNVARFLEPDEVDDLVHKCYDFGCWFPKNFPNETIPPKLHMLVCSVPQCVIEWRTLGLLSEHGLESLHAAINGDERVYCRVGSRPERLKLVFEHHGQRAMVDKEIAKPAPRLCESPSCDGRYSKKRGVKNCQKCGFIASK